MEVREYTAYDEEEILSLYGSVGWTAYTNYPQALRRGGENSMLTLAAYEDQQLVGIVRTVGDGETVVFVEDLLVRPAYQRKGIGSLLLQAVLDRFCHVRQIQLASDDTPETAAFYQKMGFRELSRIGCCGWMRG